MTVKPPEQPEPITCYVVSCVHNSNKKCQHRFYPGRWEKGTVVRPCECYMRKPIRQADSKVEKFTNANPWLKVKSNQRVLDAQGGPNEGVDG